jgi:hypothetical protein
MIHVRDEYAPMFGRQRLTLWSGAFASDYRGHATELPNGGGFMVTIGTRKLRVKCASPRTDLNYAAVDAAIQLAITTGVQS